MLLLSADVFPILKWAQFCHIYIYFILFCWDPIYNTVNNTTKDGSRNWSRIILQFSDKAALLIVAGVSHKIVISRTFSTTKLKNSA